MKKISWFKQFKGSGLRRPEGLILALFVGILLMGSFAPRKVLGDSSKVSNTPSDARPVWLLKDTWGANYLRQVLPNSPEYHKLLSYPGRNRWRVVPDNAAGRAHVSKIMYQSFERLSIQRLPQKDLQGRQLKPRAEYFSSFDLIKLREEREKRRFSTRGRDGYPGTKDQQSSLKRPSDSKSDLRSLSLVIFEALPSTAPFFLRGDVNQDGEVNILDSNDLLRFFYDKEYEPPCLESADVNNDGLVQLDDALQLISYVTHGLSPPELPFPACGRDPDEPGSGKDIGCLSHEAYPKATEEEDKEETP